MKRIFTLFFAIIFSGNVFSQAPGWLWAKAMGGTGPDVGYSIALDDSGNVYTTGYFSGTVDFDPGAGVFNLTSVGGRDMFISKLDGSGNFVWVKAMHGTSTDHGYSIAIDIWGNIYTTGMFVGTTDFDPGAGVFNFTSAGGSDIFISKLDAAGNFVWAKHIGGAGGDAGASIAIDSAGSGNVFTTGSFFGTVDFDPGAGTFNLTMAGNDDIFISKLDSSGNFVWAKAMSGTGSEGASSIALDLAGNNDVYTTGYFNATVDFDPGAGVFNLTPVGGRDIFISKLDSSGNFLWAKAMGGTVDDFGHSVTLDASGNVYTTGSFQGTVDFDPGAGTFNITSAGTYDIFISKLDNSGIFVWAKAMGGINSEDGRSIALDAFGNIYTTGIFYDTADFDPGAGIFNLTTASAGYGDPFISKLNGSGNFVWAKAMGGTSNDYGFSIALGAFGNPHVTGYFSSPSISFGSTTLTNVGGDDIFIAKLDTVIIITENNEIENFGNSVLLSPNPATSEIKIESGEMEIAAIEIYDVVGQRLSLPLNPLKGTSASINVSSLSPGIYFVTARDEKGNSVTKKFVKM
jgi:uncharacterized membrane protein YqhA